jgi:hypothetical protein
MYAELGFMRESEQVQNSSKSYPFVVNFLRGSASGMDTCLKRRSREDKFEILAPRIRKEVGIPPSLQAPLAQKSDGDPEEEEINNHWGCLSRIQCEFASCVLIDLWLDSPQRGICEGSEVTFGYLL